MGALVAMAAGLLGGAWARVLGLRLEPAWIACVAVLGIGLLIAFSVRRAPVRPGPRAWLPFALCAAIVGQSLTEDTDAPADLPAGVVRLQGRVLATRHGAEEPVGVLELGSGHELRTRAAYPRGVRIGVRRLDVPSGSRVSVVARAQPSHRFWNPTPHPDWPAARTVSAYARLVGSPRIDRRAPFWERAAHSIRRALRARLGETLAPGAAAISRALLLNESGALDEATQDRVRDAGLSHVLAVSGLHVTLLAGVFVWVATRVLVRIARIAASTDVSRIAKASGIPFALAYALLVGDAPSAWRAALTASVGWGLAAAGRRAHPVTVTAASALLLAALRPDDLARPGFVLSIVATAALVSGATEGDEERSFARAALVVSARTTTATAPFVLWIFGHVPVIGLLANLVVVPLGGVLLPVAAVHAALALVLPPLAALTAPLVEITANAFLACCEVFATVTIGRDLPPPDVAQGVIVAVVALALLAVRTWRGRIAVALLALVSLAGAELALRHRERPRDALRATYLDVGQGDAALVDLPDGRLMVIDAGGAAQGGPDPGARVLVPILRARRRERIDVLVISHPHPDHYGGVAALLDAFDVGEVWDSGQAEGEAPEGEAARLLASARSRGATVLGPLELCGRTRVFGAAHARVLWPCPDFDSGWGPNDNSLVVELEFAGRRLLFTGDVEAHAEHGLARHESLTTVDVLKVAHHGSRTSSTPALLDVLRPHVAIASAGRSNRFGHPHPEVWSRIEARVPCAYRTDRDGGIDVRVELDGLLEATAMRSRAECHAGPARKRTRRISPRRCNRRDRDRARPGPTRSRRLRRGTHP